MQVLAVGAPSVVAYGVAVWFAWLHAVPPHHIPAIWPAGGIALAALLLGAPHERVAVVFLVLVSGVISNLLSGATPAASSGIAAMETAAVASAAWLLLRLAGGPVDLHRVSHVLFLLATTTVGLLPIVLVGTLAGPPGGDSADLVWPVGWAATALGMQIITPVILAWQDGPGVAGGIRRERLVEFGAFVILVSMLLVTFTLAAGLPVRLFLGALIAFPLILWGAWRFDQRVTTTMLAGLYVVVLGNASRGGGVFGLVDPSPSGAVLAAGGFMCAASLTGLMVGSHGRRADARTGHFA